MIFDSDAQFSNDIEESLFSPPISPVCDINTVCLWYIHKMYNLILKNKTKWTCLLLMGFFCMFFLFFSFVLVICMFDCSVVRSDIKHYKWICSRYGSGLSSIKKNKKPVSLWISRWTPSQKGRNLGHNQKHAKEYQYQFLQGWNCSKSYVGGGVSCTSGGNSWVAVISDIRVGAWCHLVKQPALAKTNK